jgi:hypothetical protein
MKELEKQFGSMGVKGKNDDNDEDEDSEIDIKVEELLEDLNINDKEEEAKRKGSLDIGAVNTETKEEENTPNTKLIGKRDRKGENI